LDLAQTPHQSPSVTAFPQGETFTGRRGHALKGAAILLADPYIPHQYSKERVGGGVLDAPHKLSHFLMVQPAKFQFINELNL
jgi:hypothetical protein